MDSIFNREYEQLALYICIPIIIGILTIGLPLIIQIINRIDDKYKSTIIVDLFYKSREYIFFISCLIISVILLFVYAFSLDSITLSDSELIQSIIDNSAIILLVISTIILLISLVFIVLLEKTFSNPYSLAKYLSRKHEKARKK